MAKLIKNFSCSWGDYIDHITNKVLTDDAANLLNMAFIPKEIKILKISPSQKNYFVRLMEFITGEEFKFLTSDKGQEKQSEEIEEIILEFINLTDGQDNNRVRNVFRSMRTQRIKQIKRRPRLLENKTLLVKALQNEEKKQRKQKKELKK